jgi:hypothetical protein
MSLKVDLVIQLGGISLTQTANAGCGNAAEGHYCVTSRGETLEMTESAWQEGLYLRSRHTRDID